MKPGATEYRADTISSEKRHSAVGLTGTKHKCSLKARKQASKKLKTKAAKYTYGAGMEQLAVTGGNKIRST